MLHLDRCCERVTVFLNKSMVHLQHPHTVPSFCSQECRKTGKHAENGDKDDQQ